ncbi:hypothetical protein [Bacillus paramobilis]|uniref:Uncharacterized protein n=1 Tax=Bacillus paramobilis TaxID=2817477 RepID=A0ABZ2VN54_9BACI
MKTLHKFKWTKVLVMALVAVLCFTIPLQEKTKAAVIDEVTKDVIENVSEEQFNNGFNAVKAGLSLENGIYKFNKENLNNSNLTQEQVKELEIFFTTQSQEVMKDIFEGVNSEDAKVNKNALYMSATPEVQQAVIPVLVAAAAAVAAFVGAAIAAQIIADVYKLVAISFCRKWQKYSKVKTACKDLGYLK